MYIRYDNLESHMFGVECKAVRLEQDFLVLLVGKQDPYYRFLSVHSPGGKVMLCLRLTWSVNKPTIQI